MKKLLLISLIMLLAACEAAEQPDPSINIPETPVVESTDQEVIVEPEDEVETEMIEQPTEQIVEPLTTAFQIEFDPLELGTIGILANWMNPNVDYPFLEGLDAQIFNQYDEFNRNKFDTMIVFYEAEFLNFYPSNNWGIEPLAMDEIIVTEYQGSTLIMARFPTFEEAIRMINQVDYRLLSIRENTTLSEYFAWQEAYPVSIRVPVTQENTESSDESQTEIETPSKTPEFNNSSNVSLAAIRQPADYCRLDQQQRNGHHEVFGFPIETIIPHKGVIDVAVIPVDFPDYTGNPDLIQTLADDLPFMTSWSEFYSGGEMVYQVHTPNQWIRAPKAAEYYRSRDGEVNEGYQGQDRRVLPLLQSQEQSVSQLIAASDSLIDWSIIDVVIFIFPVESYTEQTHLYMHMGTFQSPSKGVVRFPVWGENFYELSRFNSNISYWDWSVHEILHWQGLVGHGPINGSEYSIMTNQYASSAGLHAWEAFLLDWWSEDDFTCIDPQMIDGSITFTFDSIDILGAQPGDKSLMLPFNESEILVLEYRSQGERSTLDPLYGGIVIYYIDVNGDYVRCDSCDQSEIEPLNFWRPLRNNKVLPCNRPFDSQCGKPSPVHKPGYELIYEYLKFEVLTDNTIQITNVNN